MNQVLKVKIDSAKTFLHCLSMGVFFVVGKYSPNSRWGHSISMISEKEAVVIGGQGDKQAFCKDSIWYLNMGRFFFTSILVYLMNKGYFFKIYCSVKSGRNNYIGTEGFKQMHGKLS